MNVNLSRLSAPFDMKHKYVNPEQLTALSPEQIMDIKSFEIRDDICLKGCPKLDKLQKAALKEALSLKNQKMPEKFRVDFRADWVKNKLPELRAETAAAGGKRRKRKNRQTKRKNRQTKRKNIKTKTRRH